MNFTLTILASILLVACPSIAIAFQGAGVVSRLESSGQYKKVLELCADDASAKSLCIQGDYLYHGRRGVPMDRNRGRELFRRALELLLPTAESADADAQYLVACCQEFGARISCSRPFADQGRCLWSSISAALANRAQIW